MFSLRSSTGPVCSPGRDRAHRIGQTRNVQVDYLIGRNSLDDSLWRKIVNKVSVVSEALEGCKERLNGKGERQVEAI